MATTPHSRLLSDLLAVGAPYGLSIGGGLAVRLHGLVDRPTRSLDLATESAAPMAEIAAALTAGLAGLGWQVRELESDPLAATLVAVDPLVGDECRIEVLKETLWRPLVETESGPALAIEDVVGTKVRALADRGLAADLIDVHAAADRWSHAELEELGRRHARQDFDLTELQSRLARADWIDDTEFRAYGLDPAATTTLRTWAQTWVDDIAERLMEETTPPDA